MNKYCGIYYSKICLRFFSEGFVIECSWIIMVLEIVIFLVMRKIKNDDSYYGFRNIGERVERNSIRFLDIIL